MLRLSAFARMKSFTKTALIATIAFGIPMGTLAGIIIGFAHGLSAGVSFGIKAAAGSGLLLAGFMAIQRWRFSRARPEFTGEHLLHDGPANHFLKAEGVGGWRFLTKERLLFRSHQFNVQRHELSIPLAEITHVSPLNTATIFPNSPRFVTRSGREERFVVEANQTWCDEILRAQTIKSQ